MKKCFAFVEASAKRTNVLKIPNVNNLTSALGVTSLRSISTFVPKAPPQPPVRVVATTQDGVLNRFQDWSKTDEHDRGMYVMDLGVVDRQFDRWVSNLPDVHPHYAVKCNPDPQLIATLAARGTNFDCASGEEMRLVLNAGVAPERIIFANPIKNPIDLKFACSVGVTRMTFDNADEIKKMKKYHPKAELVLRVLPDDSGSLMRFGTKFGAPKESIRNLLGLCQMHEMTVIGASFHIGSGCFDPTKYDGAIALVRYCFDTAKELGMPALSVVDVGGGFSGQMDNAVAANGTPPFEVFAAVIAEACKKYFPKSQFPNVELISEPGRYFATAWGTLFTQVQGKREVDEPEAAEKNFLYYINDGVYGSFNCKLWDHHHPVPVPVDEFFEAEAQTEERVERAPLKLAFGASMFAAGPTAGAMLSASAFSTSSKRPTTGTFFGPTCDSLDKVIEKHPISELEVGDFVAFRNMGAYTRAAGVEFNGCFLPVVHYIRSMSP